MKAITLYQPWASLWLTSRKFHETRGWPTQYRGPLAVHAGKRQPRVQQYGTLLYELCCREFGHQWMDRLPLGAVLGVVELIDCRSTKVCRPLDHEDYVCGNWDPGRYAWQRGGYRLLPAPIPYRGRQGLFEVPDDILARAAA